MKRKSKLKRILIPAICLILVASIGAGIYFFPKNSKEPVNVFSFNYIGMTEYWGDSQESSGYVQSDQVQTVFLSGTQTVNEIKVNPGDSVKKGDVLMTFDTTLSDLTLERKRLDVEKLKLQLEDAKDQLARIRRMKPMVIPKPSENPEENKNLGIALTDPFQISILSKYDGSSKEKALICWLHSDTPVDDEIFRALLDQAVAFQTENAQKEEDSSSSSTSDPDVTPPETPTEIPAETPTEIPTDAPTDPPSGENQEPIPEAPTEPEPIQVNQFYVVFKVTEGNMSLGTRTAWQGILVIKDGGRFKIQFFDASSLTDHMLSASEQAPQTPQIDFGSGFTSSQLAEMRAQQEKTIKDLEFQIKMAETEYKIMQTEVSDGNVYAEVDGVVVSLLTEDEAQMTGQPLMKVSGGGGFYVEGSIGELDRNSVSIGSEVTINDWRTGMMYTGTVESIGDYPSSNGYWNGMGNPTATYYPFTVFVADEADLQSGSYVSIMYSAGSSENGIYLENPFLRTEGGKSYVYIRGEDGNLEQRFVTTGKSLWGSYTEILEGITPDDFLAFPYGTDVKPGAPAVEAEIRALYE